MERPVQEHISLRPKGTLARRVLFLNYQDNFFNWHELLLLLQVAVGQYKLQFESYEQQDSHEFLTFLLDWMHNELKKVKIYDG